MSERPAGFAFELPSVRIHERKRVRSSALHRRSDPTDRQQSHVRLQLRVIDVDLLSYLHDPAFLIADVEERRGFKRLRDDVGNQSVLLERIFHFFERTDEGHGGVREGSAVRALRRSNVRSIAATSCWR